jgi:AcrR family transcriptional regulator
MQWDDTLAAEIHPVQRLPGTTRVRLINAAEQLFAARGIDAVSLREINRASGARNAIAVQYHFEDRAGVVRAVLQKHRPDVEARRHALLDQCEADGAPDLRCLAAALVRPWSAKLADADGGPQYLQIHAELLNRPRPHFETATDPSDSIHRWRSQVEPLLGEDAIRLHRRFTAMRLAAGELGRRASTAPHTDDRLFVSHLIDLVAAILAAPVSDETLRLADDRDTSRSASPRSQRRGRVA